MSRVTCSAVCIFAALITASSVRGVNSAVDANWPSFRGRQASGVAEGFRTPVEWNADDSDGRPLKNVRWKTRIPGLSHSSPIIWGEKLFVVTAVSEKPDPQLKIGLFGDGDSADDNGVQSWDVYCLDKRDGRILWTQTLHKGPPKVRRHTKATHANTTLATDGKRLIAFLGSEGLFCYGLDGKFQWNKDLGILPSSPHDAPELQLGWASSPAIHDGRVYVQCDVLERGFLACFDLSNGREVWRTPRKDVATWSTPTLYDDGRRTQMIVNGWKHIGGYDAKTGRELWKLEGGGDIPVPAPVVADGLIYIANAHGRISPIYAIRASAEGEIKVREGDPPNSHLAWWEPRNGDYLQTPIVYRGLVYSGRSNGVVNCYDAVTGKRHYQERLGSGATGFTASPVAADGKVYFTSEEGEVHVLEAGPVFKKHSTNAMGEICMATPAISEGSLYFHTRGHIVAVSERQPKP